MILLGFVARWAHLVAGVLLVGAWSTVLLAGASDRPTARRWDSRLAVYARWLAVIAIVAGIGALMAQTVLLTGRTSDAFALTALSRVVLDTQAGLVWLARQGLLLLVVALLIARLEAHRRVDWLALRGQGALLSAVAIALLSMAGHAAAVEPGRATAVAVDVGHLVATGVWAGGLFPLAMLLAVASRADGADARPYAVLAARRFSALALATMLVLVVTGIVNTAIEVGSFPGLVGTTHGRLLLVKLAVLVAILVIARANRARLIPQLSGAAESVGRPAMRRLMRAVVLEGGLALALLGVVSVMTVTPPARHQQPTWPFPFRFTLDALVNVPGASTRVLVATQLTVLGIVVTVASAALTRRRWAVVTAGILLAAIGLGIALPPLAVDAYPTTYQRPTVPYGVTSIASGETAYRQHCALCHGPVGAGDTSRGMARPPANLRAAHTAEHTAGDLFWWITHGIPTAGMPGFADRLGEAERWDVVNFLRALTAAESARDMGPTVGDARPWLVAPDFSFSVGPAPARSLREYRGRRIVVLVLYTLPGSHPRLAQLAGAYQVLNALGVEVIAVPTDAAPDAIRRLGDSPRILFPVVTDGAADIVDTYRLFTNAPHAEFLVDRLGYLRARWAARTGETRDVNLLLAEVQALNEEKVTVVEPAEHVH